MSNVINDPGTAECPSRPPETRVPYASRSEAGQILAAQLSAYSNHHHADRNGLYVLALPRGGVPVAAIIAAELGGALDLILVRKLGLPGYQELAMGAIASGNAQVMNDEILELHKVSQAAMDKVVEKERRELERREKAYRGSRPFPDLAGRRVILVDDGLATGATMRAAIKVVRNQLPRELIVAVPVAPESTVEQLRHDVDAVVCPATPEPFMAIGRWYDDFSQTTDDEVTRLLEEAWQRHP